MTPRHLILWVHVLCGVGWVGASLIFLLATLALDRQPADLHEFLERVAPRTNRIGMVCAMLIPATGFANLAFAARLHGYQLPIAFALIVAAKILLLLSMVLMLMRATKIYRSQQRESRSEARGLALAYGIIAGCGSVALLLGLWLSGL